MTGGVSGAYPQHMSWSFPQLVGPPAHFRFSNHTFSLLTLFGLSRRGLLGRILSLWTWFIPPIPAPWNDPVLFLAQKRERCFAAPPPKGGLFIVLVFLSLVT